MDEKIKLGTLLVLRDGVHDPSGYFEQSLILIISRESETYIGLNISGPTDEFKSAEIPDHVFLCSGGPPANANDSLTYLQKVRYLNTFGVIGDTGYSAVNIDEQVLQRIFKQGKEVEVMFSHAMWSVGLLEAQIKAGYWIVCPSTVTLDALLAISRPERRKRALELSLGPTAPTKIRPSRGRGSNYNI